MANSEQVERLKQGVASWNAWRGEHPEIQPEKHQARQQLLDELFPS